MRLHGQSRVYRSKVVPAGNSLTLSCPSVPYSAGCFLFWARLLPGFFCSLRLSHLVNSIGVSSNVYSTFLNQVIESLLQRPIREIQRPIGSSSISLDESSISTLIYALVQDSEDLGVCVQERCENNPIAA